MTQRNQFCRILPISQTALALFLGGWGLWLRNSILSRPFWGDSTGWDTTLRFHVWPWPFKFVATLNMPAFLVGSFVAWPIGYLRPGLSEWISASPSLLFVYVLWYGIGSWLDRRCSAVEGSRNPARRAWISLLFFTLVCALAASIPNSAGGYVSYLPFGICIWIVVGVAMSLSTNLRSMRSIALICTALILPCRVLGQKPKADPPQPTQFEIARRTFFDFGPPFNYYELLFVRPAGTGTSIERITLTPAEDECFAPAKVEIASASLNKSVSAFFGGTNPCTIREKELRRELKRCKHCLVFSGAAIVMQVQCGTQARLIRADILDKDMFDPNASTPEHTSWTMHLLKSLDQAVGPGVMDKPVIAIPGKQEPSSTDLDSTDIQDLSTGKYDALFQGAPDKPSDLYRAAQNSPFPPTVHLASSTPVAPKEFVAPQYPAIARVAHVEGAVSLTLAIDATGHAINLTRVSGPPLLWGAVKNAASTWQFPIDAAGQQVQATIEFNLNCRKSTQ
jgi:hypothetical protein